MGNNGRWAALNAFVQNQMERKHVPGVALGILSGAEMTTTGLGVTNIEHPLAVTDETLFQIGSITKTFTGTALMRLVEDGRLDLDATVRSFIPDFRVQDEEASAGATIRHLLTHMGGWAGDFFRHTGAGDGALARYVAEMKDLPQVVPLGSHWSYNNAGFSVAGYILELVTGQRYERAMKELVLEPLGLARCFFDPGEIMTYRFAVGHAVSEQEIEVARPWPLERSAWPVGGIVCDVRELLRYAHSHLHGRRIDGEPGVLSVTALAEMQSAQVQVWNHEAWGLTWAINEVEGARELSHGGGTKGQISRLVLFPGHDFAFAIVTNSDPGGQLIEEVRRWILKEYLSLQDPWPKALGALAGDLSQYAGTYRGYWTDAALGMLGDKLVAQVTYKRGFPNEDAPPAPAPPPMTLDLCERDRLLVLDGAQKHARADVVRKEDGSIGWLRFSGRLHVREG